MNLQAVILGVLAKLERVVARDVEVVVKNALFAAEKGQ